MRYFAIICVSILIGAASAEGQGSTTAPSSQPAGADLKNNVLVQKAMADQEKATQEVETDFNKKLEALKTERQKKLDAIKKSCVEALRRAAAVADARNNKDEAMTIKALAESIAAEVSVEPAKKASLAMGATESVKATIFTAKSGKYPITIFGNGRFSGSGSEGTWELKNGVLAFTWKVGAVDSFQLKDGKEWHGKNSRGDDAWLQLEK